MVIISKQRNLSQMCLLIVSVKTTVPMPISRYIILSVFRVVESGIRGMVTGFVVVAGR